jgi:glycosyltransferase involved in cell wall biosynthesis
LELCGLSDRECTVIYNAVDTAIFAPVEGAKREAGLIVFVNSINPRKGIEQLMDAMNVVCGSHPEARLVAIGHDARKGVNQGGYVGQLLERVRPEYRGRVTFTGRLERNTGVLDYLRKAQVCCYPSHMETFGIAAVEAMAVGKPTVFSRTGPGPEIIEDGVSGLLCEPRDPADIASKILKILENLPLAAALGKNARCRVVQMFDKRDWVKRNLDFYGNALARKTKPS